MSAPAGTTVSGRPIVSLSLALNYALAPPESRDVFSAAGPNAADAQIPPDASDVRRAQVLANLWGYHALNLAIHLAAALALFGIVRQTLSSEPLRARFGRAATGLAWAVATLWVVHPLQTSAVTYVVQRAESLMGLWLFATLYCAIRAWDEDRSRSRIASAAAVICCALGMASKEVMAVAPLVVLLWDWTFAPAAGDRRRRLALYAALAATWILLALIVSGNHRPDAAGFGFARWPWWRYLLTQSAVIVHYLRLAIAPFPLVLDYDWPPARIDAVLPQLALMIALVAATAWGVGRRRPWAFAAGSFLLVLAPTSSVLPIVTEVAAEHRMYVPLAAVLALLVIAGYGWLRKQAPERTATRLAIGVAAVLTVAGVVLTRARNEDYQDFDRIWLDTIAKRPDNARARNNYATSLLAQGRFADAETHARAAVRVEPEAADAQQTLGVALCAQSRCAEGLPHLDEAARLAPRSADVQRNLGEACASLGRFGEALLHYQRALDARPNDLHLLNRAGWILATGPDEVRDAARAVMLGERAVQQSARQDVESLDTLAAAYAASGRFDAAIASVTAALQLAPQREPAIVPELEQRLALYRARQPFRQ